MNFETLYKNLPKCQHNKCKNPATLIGSFVDDEASDDDGCTISEAVICYGCDEHPDTDNVDKEDLPYADVVRAYMREIKG